MANDSNKVIDIATNCQEWSDLFKYSAFVIKNDIRCHTLALFDEIEEPYDSDKGYGIAKMKPFPLVNDQQIYTIRCYFFKSNTTDLFFGDTPQKIFLIAFMDYNFKTNLETDEPIKTSDKSVHDMSFGVIIDTL